MSRFGVSFHSLIRVSQSGDGIMLKVHTPALGLLGGDDDTRVGRNAVDVLSVAFPRRLSGQESGTKLGKLF